MKQEIWLNPYGGLANRMRAVNSFIEFAKERQMALNIVWFPNFEINAPFDAIFDKPYYSKLSMFEGGFWGRFLYKSPRKHNLWLSAIMAPFVFDRRIYADEFIELRKYNKLEQEVTSFKKTLIESCYDFNDYNKALSKNFIPKSNIREAINSYVKENFKQRTIGVHIRRSDNELSIKRSPLKLFIDAIDNELRIDSGTKFYVATDDKSTKEQLKEMYGDKILSIDTDCNRNSLEGIKEAVKEMWILSKTSKIYGSYYSSFSEMAAHIGATPLTILDCGEDK